MNSPRDNPAPSPTATDLLQEVLIWDDVVHEQAESSVLYFWRLSFVPEYDRTEIFAALDRVYKQAGITAHIEYETLGDFDILLRLWIPKTYRAAEIENLLFDHLRRFSLWRAHYFACQTYVHCGRIKPPDCPPRAVPIDVGDDLISSINAYNDAQAAGNCVPRPEGVEPLLNQGSLVSVPLDVKGIRVYITFDHPLRPLSHAERDEVLEKLHRKCEEIRTRWAANPNAPKPIPDVSIYYGDGTMTEFLVMARAPYGHFHAYIQELVFGLRGLSLDRLHRMRPYTHVLADNVFHSFVEHRLSVDTGAFDESIVFKGESERLEFKASFAVDVRREWRDGTRAGDARIKDFVVKTVCGFLNSPEGGTLVLGVLEVEREYEKAGTQRARFLQWLNNNFDYVPETADDGTLKLPNVVIGVEREYDATGPYHDADKYHAALRDTLKDNIAPPPMTWLRLATRKVAGREVVVLSIRPAHHWCYAKVSSEKEPQFYVREAASTRAAKGLEADLYRTANPRSSPPAV